MDVNNNEIPHTPPVAIISMGGLFPRASGLKSYWRLLYHGLDAITDVPSTHWSVDDYFDEDTRKADHVYCRRGGFLSPIPFDPTAFGIPPSNLEATDTSQSWGSSPQKPPSNRRVTEKPLILTATVPLLFWASPAPRSSSSPWAPV
jgi:hypothetical protein